MEIGIVGVRIVDFSSVDGMGMIMVGLEKLRVKWRYDPVGERGSDNGRQGYVVCCACFVHHAEYTLYLLLIGSSNETDRS